MVNIGPGTELVRARNWSVTAAARVRGCFLGARTPSSGPHAAAGMQATIKSILVTAALRGRGRPRSQGGKRQGGIA
jgi:hypothetical protein